MASSFIVTMVYYLGLNGLYSSFANGNCNEILSYHHDDNKKQIRYLFMEFSDWCIAPWVRVLRYYLKFFIYQDAHVLTICNLSDQSMLHIVSSTHRSFTLTMSTTHTLILALNQFLIKITNARMALGLFLN